MLTSHILDRLEWEWALHVALPSGALRASTAADAAAAQLARVALDHDVREAARDHDDPGLLDLASDPDFPHLPSSA